MKSIRQIIFFNFLAFLLFFSIVTPVFSFGEYEDNEGKNVSFKLLDREIETGEQERKIFVTSFVDNYKDVPLEKFGRGLRSREELARWIEEVFIEEWNSFKSSNTIDFIEVLKEGKIIGFAVVEPWKDEIGTYHLRQMPIVPEEQRHGYGTKLIELIKKIGLIKNLPDVQVKRIIVDTRPFNPKARNFYKKNGFGELENAHDLELRERGGYIGLEWPPSQAHE